MLKPKQKLTIHRSNFYRPRHLEVACLADDENCKLAIVKHVSQKSSNRPSTPTSILEIYTFRPCFAPKLVGTIIEQETIKAVFFLNSKTLLTVSLESTINLFSIRKGIKTKSLLTDFGPITCAKFDSTQGILFTGTGYGYIAAYRVDVEASIIEPLKKMQKVKAPIESLDAFPTSLSEFEQQSIQVSRPQLRSGKRKRRTSSSGEESDDETTKTEEEQIKFDYTLYGASSEGLTIYNYHKKTILDTLKLGRGSCKVTFVMTLSNGDFVVGDTKGKVTIYDKVSQTSRQTAQVLDGAINCIATESQKNNLLVVSGKDPILVVLKRDETEDGNFVIFEKIKLHHSEVTSIRFVSRKDFFTASKDGMIARFRVHNKQTKKLSLDRMKLLHHYSGYLKFHKSEMLIQDDQSLIVWKLPDASIDSKAKVADCVIEGAPVKHLLLKARKYVHAATFSRNWIAYSTQRGVHLFDRSGDKIRLCKINTKLANCHRLQICANDTRLLACSGNHVYLIDLTSPLPIDTTREFSVFPVVASCNLKSRIYVLEEVGSTNSVVMSCGPGSNILWLFDIEQGSEKPLKQCVRVKLRNHEIIHISHSGQKNRVFNVFTSGEQLLKLDLDQEDKTVINTRLDEQPRVVGLPEGECVIGLLTLDTNNCLLYSSEKIFKVDLNLNKVVNEVSDYKYIMSMNNQLFENRENLALVELKPEHYLKMMPAQGASKKSFDQ